MFKTLQTLLATPREISRDMRTNPARRLMEAAQNRATHNLREAQELRMAAMAQLSVVR